MRSRLLSLMRVLVAARPAAVVVVILGGLFAACFAGRKSRASERERMSERRARNEMERSQRGVTSRVHLTRKARARGRAQSVCARVRLHIEKQLISCARALLRTKPHSPELTPVCNTSYTGSFADGFERLFRLGTFERH